MGRAWTWEQGTKPGALGVQRRQYAGLIAQDVSNIEACRGFGMNRHTSTGWRYGRSLPRSDGIARHRTSRIHDTEPVRSPRHLSVDESHLIANRLRGGASLYAINRELGRAALTISRGVPPNRHDTGAYGHPSLSGWPRLGSPGHAPVGWSPAWCW